MKKLWNGIGEVVVGILGWVALAAITLTLVGLLVMLGSVVMVVIAAAIVVALIVGGIRRLFGIKKNTIAVDVTEGGKKNKYNW